MKTDIQTLIPEQHRTLVEVLPKGLVRSVAHGAMLLGALCGALASMWIPSWTIPFVFAALLLLQRIWVFYSNKRFDASMAELCRSGLIWREGDS